MGKKYIIELEDEPFCQEDGNFVYKVKGFNNIVFSMMDFGGLGTLTPYTEPDLEQVRKEAYDKGYDDAAEKIGSDEQAIADKAYKNGLSDAWEAVRKIYNFDLEEREELFHDSERFNVGSICEAYSASEAIEKIRQYEQAKEEQIKVGDEVISPNGKGVVTEITDIYIRIMYAKGSGQVVKPEDLTKTGRHFAEIAAVLEKMRGEQDG